MKRQRQPGFFDIAEHTSKLTQMGDPLVGLNEQINCEAFRPDLSRVHEKERKSNAGARPIDVLLMFKVLVLQQLYNLSDERIEYQIRDRLSFMRFLGLQLEDRVPDAKTVWLFRERLKELKRVEVTRQRNGCEENARIKAGETPADWLEESAKPMLRQKDVDARWTKKNNERHYGYKNHINADQGHKLVHSYAVTDAAVHDSQVFEALLDQAVDENDKKRAVYADSAYRSLAQEEKLATDNITSQICEKGAPTVA